MAWLLILTLPLYGLPVHAHAPTSATTELPGSENVGRVPRASELQPLTEPAPSSLLYVNNTDATCLDHQPCFDTVQKAIDAVQPGQTIRIQAGEYSFPKSFVPTALHASTSPCGLRSARTDTATARPERSVAKSKGEHSILRNISFRFPI
jgi:hypothetical protein